MKKKTDGIVLVHKGTGRKVKKGDCVLYCSEKCFVYEICRIPNFGISIGIENSYGNSWDMIRPEDVDCIEKS